MLTYTVKPNVYVGMVFAYLWILYFANVTNVGLAINNGGLMKLITINLCRYSLRKAKKYSFRTVPAWYFSNLNMSSRNFTS